MDVMWDARLVTLVESGIITLKLYHNLGSWSEHTGISNRISKQQY